MEPFSNCGGVRHLKGPRSSTNTGPNIAVCASSILFLRGVKIFSTKDPYHMSKPLWKMQMAAALKSTSL